MNPNPSKWPPEYDTIKVILLIVVLAIAGFFVYKYMHNSAGNSGRVINMDAGAPVRSGPIPSLPIITSAPASDISTTSARLNAMVPTMDQSNTATLTFLYGTTTKYGASTTPTVANGIASAPITGLTCNTTYYYRLTATNTVGTSGGQNRSFRTRVCS